MKASSREPEGPKIIVQYRTKGGRAYELQSRATVIAVHISSEGSARPATSWHVQAQLLKEQDPNRGAPAPVDGSGATAAAAFSQAALAWGQRGELPRAFDWEAAAEQLRNVRAI